MFAKLPNPSLSVDTQLTVTDVDDFKTEADLRAEGFLPLEETEQPSETLDIMHYYLAEYFVEDGKVKQRWTIAEYETPPSYSYSKVKILMAAQQGGFIEALLDFLESDRTVSYIWNASNVIEDNELFATYLPALSTALNKTPAEIRAFLNENCIAD